MPTRQTPPAPGYSYDSKSRGWFQSSYGSYSAAKASGEPGAAVSRRQYDEVHGRIAQQGFGTYERQASFRKEVKGDNPNVRIGKVTRDGEWSSVTLKLNDPTDIRSLLTAVASIVPNNVVFMVQGVGDASQEYDGADDDTDEQEETKPRRRKRKHKKVGRKDGLKYRNVLPLHSAKDLPLALQAIAATLENNAKGSFSDIPNEYVIQWRAAK